MTILEAKHTSVDIEALLAFNKANKSLGRPQIGKTYALIKVYSPMGILLSELKQAYVQQAGRGQNYTRDVYARNFQLI